MVNSIHIPNDIILNHLVPFLNEEETDNLAKVSNELGCEIFRDVILKQLQDPKTASVKNKDQMTMARQTHLIITKSHFSIGKKYQCLKALSAALSIPSEDEEYELATRSYINNEPKISKVFRRIALANIPHFILTRCWEIKMDWSNGFQTKFQQVFWGTYDPITSKALSALIQSYKNVLQFSIPSFTTFTPQLIITQGNGPIYRPKKPGEKEKTAFDGHSWFMTFLGASKLREKLKKLDVKVANFTVLNFSTIDTLHLEINQNVLSRSTFPES